jgi:hypothetical protein
MKEPPVTTSSELIDRFGHQVADRYNKALDMLRRSLTVSEVPAHEQFREFIATLSPLERELAIAQSALASFIHDFMSALDESDDFKVVGILKDGTEFDLRDLCPEGLHGNQLDWLEKYGEYEDIYQKLLEREFAQKKS